MEFQERCEGPPLFHDVAARLEKLGFVFARFLNLPEMPPYRGPLGFRGDGFHTSADALFLRRPWVIAERFGACRERALREPILTAIAHGQIEFAVRAGETFDADRREDPATFAERCAGDQAETMVARPDAPQAPPGDPARRHCAAVSEDADLPAPARMSAQPPRNQAETIIKRRREHTALYLKSLQ